MHHDGPLRLTRAEPHIALELGRLDDLLADEAGLASAPPDDRPELRQGKHAGFKRVSNLAPQDPQSLRVADIARHAAVSTQRACL